MELINVKDGICVVLLCVPELDSAHDSVYRKVHRLEHVGDFFVISTFRVPGFITLIDLDGNTQSVFAGVTALQLPEVMKEISICANSSPCVFDGGFVADDIEPLCVALDERNDNIVASILIPIVENDISLKICG